MKLAVEVKDAEEVFFTKEGDVVEESERVAITAKDNIHTLTISEVDSEDAGEYTVICENKFGHVTSTANLLVSG